MGHGIHKNGPSKTCGRQPLKNLNRYGLSQTLVGPFLNTLTQYPSKIIFAAIKGLLSEIT